MRQWEGEREEKTLLRRGEMGRRSGDGGMGSGRGQLVGEEG